MIHRCGGCDTELVPTPRSKIERIQQDLTSEKVETRGRAMQDLCEWVKKDASIHATALPIFRESIEYESEGLPATAAARGIGFIAGPDEGMGEKTLTVAGEYRKIERPRLLIFTWPPDWQENMPETVVRWDLEEKDGVTTVRLTHSGFTTESSPVTCRGRPHVLGGLRAYAEQQV